MDFEEARLYKFNRGRAEHGPIFLKDPLVEAYQEMLDSRNYMDEALSRGHNKEMLESLSRCFQECAKCIKELALQEGLIDHTGKKTFLEETK